MSRGARVGALATAALTHALAAATLVAGPDLGAGAPVAAAAGGLALVGGALGHRLGVWTRRDADRGWALSRVGAFWTMAVLAALVALVHFPGGLALGVALLAGYLAARDPPRASDLAFLALALETLGGVAFHAQAWQESGLFALPTLLLAAGFAAREAWDLSFLAAPDAASRAATAAAFGRLLAVLAPAALVAVALGAWLHAGGSAGWAPGEAARGMLLAFVLAGSAGAAWLLGARPVRRPPARAFSVAGADEGARKSP